MSCFMAQLDLEKGASPSDAYFWAVMNLGDETTRTTVGNWWHNGPDFYFEYEKDIVLFLLTFSATVIKNNNQLPESGCRGQ